MMTQPFLLTILQQSGNTDELIILFTLTLFILLLFWWAFRGEGEPDTRTSPFAEPDLVRDPGHHHHEEEHPEAEPQVVEAIASAESTAPIQQVTEAEESTEEPVVEETQAVVVEEVKEEITETVEEVEETAVEDTPPPPPEPVQPDNLKKIEGIGPKISRILNEAGILTFRQLADTSVSTLEKIVREDAGIRIAFPDTWPEQAALAAEGHWEELEVLQDNLKGGRKA